MKALALAASAAALLVAGPALAQDWRAAADQDLTAMHDTLKADHPAAVIDKDSGAYRSWIDTGYAQARERLGKVSGTLGYDYLLRSYANGFRDATVSFNPTWAAADPAFALGYPGFATAWKGGAYTVAWTKPGDSKLPPVGAKLISCDKVPAETIARTRLDLWEGDLNQPSERARTAPYLLWDRANPFVGPLPAKCDFDVGGRKKTFPISFEMGAMAERKAAYAAATRPAQSLAVEAWGADKFWIRLPSFADEQNWDGLIAQIEAQRDAIHNASMVVVDMRGANDGPGRQGYRIANYIWDADVVRTYQPQFSDVAYRASPANRAFYSGVRDNLKQDGRYYLQWARWDELIAQFDAALAAGQPLVHRDESIPVEVAQPANPNKGKIVVLTDAWCARACLNMMELFTRLPGVVHAGQATGGDTPFIGETMTALPSGYAKVGLPTRAWVTRTRPANAAYVPTLAYSGDIGNEPAVKAWLETAVK